MDDVLKDLKRIREDVEMRFNELLERMESEQARVKSLLDSAGKSLKELAAKDSGDSTAEATAILRKGIDIIRQSAEIQSLMVQGLREAASLQNARNAELARQLTVLPLERMDLVLDKFERRLESFEVELQRLAKKAGK